MESWRDRIALVTGGSAGIGAAICRTLVERGMRVATCARRLDRLDALARDLGVGDERLLRLRVDLRDEAQILAMFAEVREQWGGVDVLVNNAGLGHKAPLVSGATEKWRDMLEVNVLALCICTREAIMDMQRRDVAGRAAIMDMQRRGVAGHVLHISSMSGYRVPDQSGVYAGSKFAVRALTEALRQELRALGSAIRVTAISPGFVESEFAELYHQSAAAVQASYGGIKVLDAANVAEAVVYALSQPEHVQIHDILLRPTGQRS
jgi:NADP-dependent 3-hydroxy acid dehydrogenase YdfG